jgi:hypothetical protein
MACPCCLSSDRLSSSCAFSNRHGMAMTLHLEYHAKLYSKFVTYSFLFSLSSLFFSSRIYLFSPQVASNFFLLFFKKLSIFSPALLLAKNANTMPGGYSNSSLVEGRSTNQEPTPHPQLTTICPSLSYVFSQPSAAPHPSLASTHHSCIKATLHPSLAMPRPSLATPHPSLTIRLTTP